MYYYSRHTSSLWKMKRLCYVLEMNWERRHNLTLLLQQQVKHDLWQWSVSANRFLIVEDVFFPLFIYTCMENYTWSTFCFWFPLFGYLTDELKLCGLEIMQLTVVSLLCICPSVTVRTIKCVVRNDACKNTRTNFVFLKKRNF